MPTERDAEAWSKDRFSRMARDTPCLAGRISDPKSRDGANRILHKRFPGGRLTIIGANAPLGLASRPIRILLCDEVDCYPVTAGAEADYREGDFVERVRAASGGNGVDVVNDGVGRDTWRGACLRQRGMFVCFGQSSGPVEGFGLPDVARGSFSIHYIAEVDELRSRAADLFAAVIDGSLEVRVNKRLPLTEVAGAHRAPRRGAPPARPCSCLEQSIGTRSEHAGYSTRR